MIVFDLKCSEGHQFESWFRSSAAFEEQRQAALIECPYCGSHDVAKAPMAPNVSAKGNQVRSPKESPPPGAADNSVTATAGLPADLKAAVSEAAEVMQKLRKHVESNCENVGDRFADEARKIHYGESEERGIFGESTIDEARELLDEGIDIVPLPGARRTDA